MFNTGVKSCEKVIKVIKQGFVMVFIGYSGSTVSTSDHTVG